MPQNKSADEILASAKAALAHANTLSTSVAKEQAPYKTDQEYANAPYSLVKKWGEASKAPAKPAAETGIKKEAHDTGASIKANMDNAAKALQ